MSNGYVYIISFEDSVLRKLNPYVKIGMTFDIKKRVSGIQTGSPLQLKFFGFIECNDPRSIERFLHNLLRKDRLVGEWFIISHGLIDAIQTRYQIRENCLDDLISSIEDTPETIRIKELEAANKKLQQELITARRNLTKLQSSNEHLEYIADLWSKERSEKERKHQIEVQQASDATRK